MPPISWFDENYEDYFWEVRPDDWSSTMVRLANHEIYWSESTFAGEIDISETQDDKCSKSFQVRKVLAFKKYLEEVKEPENENLFSQATLFLADLMTAIEAIDKLIGIFGGGGIQWNGFDIGELAGNFKIISQANKDYLDAKKDYYEVLPSARESFTELYDVGYDIYSVPDDIKKRHREIGILQAKILNENRNNTYKYIGKVKKGRAYLLITMNIASQISPQIKAQRDKLMEIQQSVMDAMELVKTIRTTLIAIGPVVARNASPNGDGTIATLHSGAMGLLTAILDTFGKLMMYVNYFLGINNDYEEYLGKCRVHDTFAHEYAVQM